MGEMNRARSK